VVAAHFGAASRLLLDHLHRPINRIEDELHPFRSERDRVHCRVGEFGEILWHSPFLFDIHPELHGQLSVDRAVNPFLNRLDWLRYVGPRLCGRWIGCGRLSRGSGFVRWQNVLSLDLGGLFGSGLRAGLGGGPVLFAAAAESARAQGNKNERLFHRPCLESAINGVRFSFRHTEDFIEKDRNSLDRPAPIAAGGLRHGRPQSLYHLFCCAAA